VVRNAVCCALSGTSSVIPVLVDDAQIPAMLALPEPMRALANFPALRVRADPDFNADIERLAETCRASLSAPLRTVSPS